MKKEKTILVAWRPPGPSVEPEKKRKFLWMELTDQLSALLLT
jgi:hypothetical protein